MAKRAKLQNTGEVNEIDPADELASFGADTAADNSAGNGDETTGETTEESEQDIADQEAAGVADKPTRTAANGSNQQRTMSPKVAYNALKARVQKLGEITGGAKTSMIELAEIVTEAAADDTITIEQVPEIYDRFKAGVVKASNYEDAGEVSDEAALGQAPAKSIEQQLSKLRQFVILGGKYAGDALEVVRRARNMHIGMCDQANKDPEFKKTVKPGSTYSVLVDTARAQLGKNKKAHEAAKAANQKFSGLAPTLTDDELRALMTQDVAEAREMTGADKLLAALITAKAAYNGSPKRNPVPSKALENGIEWLRTALGETAPDLLTKHEQDAADAAERQRIADEKKNAPKEPKKSKAERQAELAQAAPGSTQVNAA